MKIRKQNGLTLVGFAIVLVLVVFFAYVAMRIVPLYLEYNAVVSALNDLQREPGAASMSPQKIKNNISNRLWVSYSSENVKREHIRITRSNGIKVRIAYEVRRPLLGNIDLILSFDRSVGALTHRSLGANNNERLEFLGDSVLNLVISSRLYELHSEAQEGDLSRMRARLVRGVTLSEIASSIELGKHLKLGEGEMKSGGFRRASILADAFEALLGAIFLDGGYAVCRTEILRLFDPLIEGLPDIEDLKDAKTRLQEWLQARGRPLPEYDHFREEGADHAKQFHVQCKIPDGAISVEAVGNSRRKAEQAAAKDMLGKLQVNGST